MRDSFEQQLPAGHVPFDEPLDVMLVFRLPKPKTVVRDWPTLPPIYRDWETDRKSTRLNSSHRL